MNSLFMHTIYDAHNQPRVCEATTKIEKRQVSVMEHGVKVNLTLIDTPGFGDALDNSKWLEFAPLVEHFRLI